MLTAVFILARSHWDTYRNAAVDPAKKVDSIIDLKTAEQIGVTIR